jgi:hypothetical protein
MDARFGEYAPRINRQLKARPVAAGKNLHSQFVQDQHTRAAILRLAEVASEVWQVYIQRGVRPLAD